MRRLEANIGAPKYEPFDPRDDLAGSEGGAGSLKFKTK